MLQPVVTKRKYWPTAQNKLIATKYFGHDVNHPQIWLQTLYSDIQKCAVILDLQYKLFLNRQWKAKLITTLL